MPNLKQWINNLPAVKRIIKTAQTSHPKGFEGLSLYQVGVFFFREIGNNKLNDRSAAVTYNFLMAIPPTLLFLFSLIPYLPLGNVQYTITDTIKQVMPQTAVRESLISVLDDFLNHERRDLLSFGVLLTLFYSSNGMMGLMRSFDRSLPVYVKRTGLKRRWTAIKLTIMLLCVAIISLGVLIIQTSAVNSLLLRLFNSLLLIKLISLIVVVGVIFCSISIIYTYGPSLTHRFTFVSVGSIFATLTNIIATTVFFFLVNNFINYNKIYGSIGTLIAFMAWMWINTLVILIGYELNLSILLAKSTNAPKIIEL
ncbi:MAG: YihY/virulence factor BrkB family protein [Bacteroidetes bacterium]|nr:YihY/virulence factor BrkB family protein [Bacteroidota bacterium]MBS1740808.1 YihY/virulence factor BrkB family protein [Bacteroidota bacterium]